jgi:hypothetical protein
MDVKNTNTGTSVSCENEEIDSGRRQALARLGLAAAVGYAVPTLLSLTSAHADSSGASGGDSSGGDSSSGGGSDSDSGSGDTSSSESGGATTPTQPTTPTTPTTPSDSSGDTAIIVQ